MLEFAAYAKQHGVLIAEPIPDGRIHRCPTADHPKRRDGSYRFFGDWGWFQDWSNHGEAVIWQASKENAPPVAIPRREIERLKREDEKRRAQAAVQAAQIVRRCRLDLHPYLTAKGFTKDPGLVDVDGRLVIPMRDCRDYTRVNSLQWISDAGEKKFLPGGTAKGSIFIIGKGDESWLCEGFATGLSIRAALKHLHRPARVVVCFSASNLAHVASQISGRRHVVADHDRSGTGERFAVSTGLPWVMPPDMGHDANDMHQAHGVASLAELMRLLL